MQADCLPWISLRLILVKPSGETLQKRGGGGNLLRGSEESEFVSYTHIGRPGGPPVEGGSPHFVLSRN